MKQLNATQDNVVVLTADQAAQVGGGLSPLAPVKVLQAEDMYGNTMSVEDYMDWTAREHHWDKGDSIHDFPGGPGQ